MALYSFLTSAIVFKMDGDDNFWDELEDKDAPVSALGLQSRTILSENMNNQQVIMDKDSCYRDWRGLAHRLGCSYNLIEGMKRDSDPAGTTLLKWGSMLDTSHTIKKLISVLEEMERYDVICDMKEFIIADITAYVKNQTDSLNTTLGVADSDRITVDDRDGHIQKYDAYVCYADEDLDFVRELSGVLEKKHHLKLVIRQRDVLGGLMAYETFRKLVEERCNKVLVVCTPNFMKCKQCEFQRTYVESLQVENDKQKIIPIIYQQCDYIKGISGQLTKIDLTNEEIIDWSWNKLVNSISPSGNGPFIDHTSRNCLPRFMPSQSKQSYQSELSERLPTPPQEEPSLPEMQNSLMSKIVSKIPSFFRKRHSTSSSSTSGFASMEQDRPC